MPIHLRRRAFVSLCECRRRHCFPPAQLYIEGSSYDSTTETWTTTESDFKIGVIASGGKLSLTDISLTAAVDSSETGTVGLTSSTTSVLSDPSTPSAPTSNGLSADGALPTYRSGASVPYAFGLDTRGGNIKAPFSHDARAGGIVPEPSAALLFGHGTLFVSTHTRRR